METLEALELLAERAHRESPPRTDVPVNIEILRASQLRQSYLFPMAWSAGISLVAASLAIMLTLHGTASTTTTTDSVTALFAHAQVEMP